MIFTIYPKNDENLDRWWSKQQKTRPNRDHLAKNWLNFG